MLGDTQPFPEGVQVGDFVNPGSFWFGDLWLEVVYVSQGTGWWTMDAIQYNKYGTQPLIVDISYDGVRKACCGPMAAEVLKRRGQRLYAAEFRHDPLGIQTLATAKPRRRTNRD